MAGKERTAARCPAYIRRPLDMGTLYFYIISGIGRNGPRRVSAMRRTYSLITILVIYLLSCIPAPAALVVCVRADGTARLASARNACHSNKYVARECHGATCGETDGHRARPSVMRGRCCNDYPVVVSAAQVTAREPEKSAAASVDAARPAHLAPDLARGRILAAELGPEQTFPTHIKTVILLI